MTLKTLMAAVMAAGFALPLTAGAAGATDKFNVLDANSDGVIDRQEAAADPSVAAAFDKIDAAGSGKITPDDFAAWEEVKKPTDPAMTPGTKDAPMK